MSEAATKTTCRLAGAGQELLATLQLAFTTLSHIRRVLHTHRDEQRQDEQEEHDAQNHNAQVE